MKRRDFVQTLVALTALPRQGTWKTWRVNGPRVNQHLTDLSQFGRNPQGGVSRVAFSDADIAGRRFMMDLMRDAGLSASIDPVGNIIGVRGGGRGRIAYWRATHPVRLAYRFGARRRQL